MRPSFLPRLVNGPLFDPVVYVRILNERKSLLFDCGHFEGLAPRELLSLEAVCISHTHMDHFMGLDRVLRTILHRDQPLTIYGPEGITGKALSKLRSYTWNLSSGYALEITICEVLPGRMHITRTRADAGFDVTSRSTVPREGARISEGPRYTLDAVILEHTVPCLAYVLKEPFHLNILKNAFAGRGYIPGAWLDTLKAHIFAGRMDELITVSTHGGTEKVRVSRLKEELVITTPGQSVAFVTDISCSPENIAALKGPAHGADMLFIEAYYLHELKDHAAARGHLTARQAGMIAGMLGAGQVFPMHVSPRYHDRLGEIRAEVEAARREASEPGGSTGCTL
ncbi:MAG: MBL fold metallo-hydrolase [Desulfomonilia bacterium]|jgi:ribonuclease Z|uniref:Ribonuclease BN n=1 Tax=anaerobic digester metagenome TaxID=1263854 RepID=A0A485M5A4_9ZZZZ|nr:MBL fold metallo-hydrolase [Pseudomonadota bacterium]HON37804.1 MBL fold metallo-hydrolase [Deltaproteobacteria bacterium]HRS55695.1 MBL fold metallo-hydrolase [Desulfomonilia bacterium]HPD20830.1 MBL fold metallo-hydrolase [Deltaproteobacteria bacterium]HPX18353.1 MBL fold metallo-hydrolase [Deltaproteobacteria bacterium]